MDQENHHHTQQSAGSESDWLPYLAPIRAPDALLPTVLTRLGLANAHYPLGQSAEALMDALNDPAWWVRVAATRTLGERGEITAIEPLVRALSDSAWQVRTAASQALGSLGELVPAEPLVVATQDEDVSVRAAAIHALGKLGERVPLEPLLATLHDDDWLVREVAAKTLGTLGERVPIEPLVAAVHDENAFVCRAAALALVQAHFAPVSAPALEMAKSLEQQRISSRLQVALNAALTSLITWSHNRLASKRHVVAEERYMDNAHVPPSGPRKPITSERQLFPRRIAGGLAALLIAISMLFAWLPRAHYPQPITLWHQPSVDHGGTVLFTYQGREGVEGPPVWMSESRYLAFLSSFGYSVQVWDSIMGKLIQNSLEPVPYAGPHTASAWSWSPDGRYLAVTSEDTSSRDAAVQVWDVITGRNTLTVYSHANGLPYTAWSFDGTRIAFSGDDGAVQIWDPLTGQKLLTFAGHPGARHGLFWSNDNALLLVSSPDGTFQLWDTFTGTNISTFHDATASLVALSPDGRWLVSKDDQQALDLRDYSNDQQTFHVWNTFTGHNQVTYQGPPGGVSFLEWSPEGSRVLIANDSEVRIWDAITGQTLLAFQNPALNGTSQPSFQSGRIFAANDSEVQIWNSLAGHTILSFPDPATSMGWQISPNGQYFAFGSLNDVQVWDVVTGRKVSSHTSRIAHVQVVAWSPDSQRIAFGRSDGTVELWNAVTGSGILTYHGLAQVVSLTWSPGGRLIAATSEDNTMHVLQAT